MTVVGKTRWIGLPWRLASPQQALEARDRLKQRRILHPTGKVQCGRTSAADSV